MLPLASDSDHYTDTRLTGVQRLVCSVMAAALFLAAGGCCSHPGSVVTVINKLNANEPVLPATLFSSGLQSRDRVLWRMERGRAAFLVSDRQLCRQDFDVLLNEFRTQDQAAVVSVGDIGNQGAAVLVNDNVLPYRGEDYERVMAMTYLCLSHLLDGRLEDTASGGGGARPVANRMRLELERLEQKHFAEIQKAQQSSPHGAEANANTQAINERLSKEFAGMDAVAGKVKSSFQSAYAFSVIGLVYEMCGDLENAKVMYRKALELAPSSRSLQQDVKRLTNGTPYVGPDQGELVVFFEDDFVAIKQEMKFPVPLFLNGAVTATAVAFPYYSIADTVPIPLQVLDNQTAVGSTELICPMNAMAVRALKDHIPALVTRQVLRTAAKAAVAYGATKAMENRQGRREDPGEMLAKQLVGIGVGIAMFASENADLRSWITLPNNVQLLRVPLAAGENHLTFQYAAGPRGILTLPLTSSIPKGGKTIVWLGRTGAVMRCQSVAYPAPENRVSAVPDATSTVLIAAAGAPLSLSSGR